MVKKVVKKEEPDIKDQEEKIEEDLEEVKEKAEEDKEKLEEIKHEEQEDDDDGEDVKEDQDDDKEDEEHEDSEKESSEHEEHVEKEAVEDSASEEEAEVEEEPETSTMTSSPQAADDIFGKSTPQDKSGNKSLIMLIAVILGILVLGGGGFYFLRSAGPTPTPTPTPVEEVTPTEAPTVDLSEYELQVLNGSGVSGAAANVQEILEDQGFTVDSVGNADSQEYTETEIEAKEGVSEAFIEKLKESLSVDYEVSDSVVTLNEDEDVDVIVTLGSSSN